MGACNTGGKRKWYWARSMGTKDMFHTMNLKKKGEWEEQGGCEEAKYTDSV